MIILSCINGFCIASIFLKSHIFINHIYIIIPRTMGSQIQTPERKKGGRPKIKHGKRVGFYLSFDTLKMLEQMTTLTRNKSEFLQNLIIKEYSRPAQ